MYKGYPVHGKVSTHRHQRRQGVYRDHLSIPYGFAPELGQISKIKIRYHKNDKKDEFELYCYHEWRIKNIKETIEQCKGIAATNQRLYLGESLLLDSMRVSDCNIHSGSLITMRLVFQMYVMIFHCMIYAPIMQYKVYRYHKYIALFKQ